VARANRIVHGCADPKPEHLTAHGARLVQGSARLQDAHTVAVGDEVFTGEQIIVATGVDVARPPIEGLQFAITHVELLQVQQPPKRLAIIGGGLIAFEFAYMFARLGTTVDLFVRRRLLAGVDAEVRDAVIEHAAGLGVTCHTGAHIQSLAPDGSGYRMAVADDEGALQHFDADVILLAAGQTPAVADLGLEQVGVEVTSAGIVTDASLRTSVATIWAIGDVRAGATRLSQTASSEGQIAARNAVLGRRDEIDERVVPYLVGLTPPVAAVGLTEEEAREAGHQVGTHSQAYKDVCPAGNVVGEPIGFFKVVFDAKTGKLLGGHSFGAGSPELVQQVAFALRGNLTLREAGATLFTFPGLCEVVWYALRPHPGDPL
jgi:pyruvate/2-oxoglutarate dehydrogenase complex dihydrolipoamide dehydrogenase (E3) component